MTKFDAVPTRKYTELITDLATAPQDIQWLAEAVRARQICRELMQYITHEKGCLFSEDVVCYILTRMDREQLDATLTEET